MLAGVFEDAGNKNVGWNLPKCGKCLYEVIMTSQTSSDSMSEVYLQISPNILGSFPKFRPPVALYFFDESVAQVKKYHEAEKRLGKDEQQAVADFAEDGTLFLLREDYRVYAKHLSQNLGLVLTEDDFTPQEVAEIFFLALRDRMTEFLAQPTEKPYEALSKDISILNEYIWTDPSRVEHLLESVRPDYDWAVHSVNTLFVGLALFVMALKGKLNRAALTSLAMGLILHDMGMVNVSTFILENKGFLMRPDRESIEHHVEGGFTKLKRLGVNDPIIMQCVLQHHERLDGAGYPSRVIGKDLTMPGRLCGIADSYCAMISERPHRKAKDNRQAALAIIKDPKKYDAGLAKLLGVLLTQGVGAVLQPA